MKKLFAFALVLTLAVAALAGCGKKEEGTGSNNQAGSQSDKKETKKIVVGASVTPHAEILEKAKSILAAKGYELKIIEYTDYVQPNVALDAGDLDANYFQHQPYLDQFNQERGMELVSVAIIHYEPFGVYPGKTKSFDDLKEGAQIAVPNDGTNEARALLLLEAQGLIKLKEGVGMEATKNDIAENPRKIEIVELEAGQLARSLQDVDMAVINGNYAIQADLNVSKDAIAVEDKNSLAADTYGNIIAVKKGNENKEEIKALVEALQSDEIRQFINDTFEGAVVPKF
jgi:D-methionine transport system substrate-binding protein